MRHALFTWRGAAAIWSLLFAAMHVFWLYAYYAWPAAGRAMLGPMFDRAFASPRFRIYDLLAGVLFFVTGLAPLSVVRPSALGRARIVRGIVWLAAVLFTARGAAGVLLDTLIVLGVIGGTLSRFMFYDVWFLAGGGLFIGALHQHRREQDSGSQRIVPI